MWGEDWRGRSGEGALATVTAWLRDGRIPEGGRIVEKRHRRIGAALEALFRTGLRRGLDPVRHAPRGAVCLNASHFPLDWPSHVRWLESRRDVRLVVFVHDVLPVDRPGDFWAKEAGRHKARLALLARRGGGAIVTTHTVAERLQAEMAARGRSDLPVLVATPPVAPVFHQAPRPDPAFAAANYFVACGTLEPRKNYGLLLRLWRRLVRERGEAAPKLVIVGKRGWLYDVIVAELADPALARHVIEVAQLTTGDYKALLDQARALLAPSLAEGFGLPVAEALACGVPVIASDIPPFREQRTDLVTLLDPHADDAWYEAVEARASSSRAQAAPPRQEGVTSDGYLRQVSGFLGALG